MTTKSPDNILDIEWPTSKVLAFTTTRLPAINLPSSTNSSRSLLNTEHLRSAFTAFNLGDHVGDCAEVVTRNRASLLEYLPKNIRIQWLEQVHGNHVADIQKYEKTPIIADAAITRNRHIALAIMTADCLPILLSNKEGSEVAAIHGGWRPLAANIIEQTIGKMKSSANDIYAWMGPCISSEAFEVGEEVKQTFCLISDDFESAFQPVQRRDKIDENKFLADLQLIALIQLTALGVKDITKLKQCTYTNSKRYYSYRRDGKTGRMASVICLK